jgi:hypothetical protein
MPAKALEQSVASKSISRGRRVAILLLALMILGSGGALLAFREGMIPARLSPLPVIDLAQPDAWLLDWRLAELKGERDLCARVLRPPYIEAQPIPDQPIAEGCGWTAAVRISSVSGARLSTDKLSCQSAAGLALWIAHDVQPLAVAMLGQRVISIRQLGTYSCRNVVGSPLFKGWRSAHATANAIDIAGFTLADGRVITLQGHWKGAGAEAAFLKAIHKRACRYFRVAIGPDYNAAHHDHFHFDRGIGSVCR